MRQRGVGKGREIAMTRPALIAELRRRIGSDDEPRIYRWLIERAIVADCAAGLDECASEDLQRAVDSLKPKTP